MRYRYCDKMNRELDVATYFEGKGYKVTRVEERASEPEIIVEKNGVKKTVDVIEWTDESKSLSQSVYDRIMSGGFFVIRPSFATWDTREICVLTKDDIKHVAKTYYIWWNEHE